MDRRYLFIGLGLVLVIFGGAALAVTSRGRSLLTLTTDSAGTVTEPPESIAYALGVSVEVAALACCVQSEAGGEPDSIKTAVGLCIVNLGGGAGVMHVLAPKGTFGRQGAQGRQAATRVGPSQTALDIAAAIMNGSVEDFTGGAQQFDSPKAQRALLARDPSYTKTPEQVASSRMGEGKELVLVPGIDEEQFRMWRRA